MSNVLSEEKKQQVIALGKLGWPLRRIEQVAGVRRETASAYLKSAGAVVCLPGWGRRAPAKPANEVTTDSGQPISPPTTQQNRATSVCEPYCALIEQGSVVAGMPWPSGRTWSPIQLSPRLPDREAFCSQAARI
jgi:hypothetical protein